MLIIIKSVEKAHERETKKAETISYKKQLRQTVLDTKDCALIEKEKAFMKNKAIHDTNKTVEFLKKYKNNTKKSLSKSLNFSLKNVKKMKSK